MNNFYFLFGLSLSFIFIVNQCQTALQEANMRFTLSMSEVGTWLLMVLVASASIEPHMRMTLEATGEQTLPTSEDIARQQVCKV